MLQVHINQHPAKIGFQEQHSRTMSLPGIGVFGTGPSTLTLVPYLKKEGFRIEAIWGRTTEDAEVVAHTLDIPFSTSRIDDVLLRKDVDLILILCPPSHHSQIAVKALGIGKHVAVPPPAGTSQNETLRMVQAAQYYPSLISIAVYGLRFLPAFVKLKHYLKLSDSETINYDAGDEIAKNLIGKVTMCDVRIDSPNLITVDEAYSWACDEHMGGGILNQFGSHVIDLLQYLTGFKATRVHGTVRTFTKTTDKINGIRQISSDDFAVFQMECIKDNWSTTRDEMFVTVTLNGCSQQPNFNQEVLICGTKGTFVVRNGDLYIRRQNYGGDGHAQIEEKLHSEKGDITLGAENNNKSLYARLPEMFPRGTSLLFRHLSEKLKTANREESGQQTETLQDGSKGEETKELLASFDDALYVHAVMEAIRISSKEKTWSKVCVER